MKEDLENNIKDLEAKIRDNSTPQGLVIAYKDSLYKFKRELKSILEEEFRKVNLTNVYYSDDYAGCRAGDYNFYYGYEVTKCPVKSHKNSDDCYEKDCEESEWCFTADKGDTNIATWRRSEISLDKTDVLENLILGMCKFIKENIKN